MNVVSNFGSGVNERAVDQAVECLRRGDIIIYPTDTLYALGVDALNGRAVERLCRLKGINPDKNLMSIVCADLSQAAEYARIDNRAFRLMKEFTPGPVTFVLPASTNLPKVFRGRRTVGVRVPECAFARALAEALGNPVMTTSVPVADGPDGLAEVADPRALGLRYATTREISLLIDGGDGGTEGSTIVDCTDSSAPIVLREGPVDLPL